MMPMIQVIGKEAKTFEAEEGKKLVLSLMDQGVDILHRCGGNARCATCRVEIIEGGCWSHEFDRGCYSRD